MKSKKASLKVPAVINEEIDDDDQDEVASEFETDSEENESDVELQKAFAEGKLQPGLNALVACKKNIIVNNVNGLKAKLEEIKNDYDWIERLDLVNEPLKQSADLTAKYGDISLKINREGVVSGEERNDPVQHDFKREMLFYRQAQAAVLEGIPRLKKMKIITRRPDDYFAQMVKTDVHMKKVQENLNAKKESIERSDQAKKMREMKKMGKQIQNQVLQKRQKDKKDLLNRIKDYQKGKTRNLELDDVSASVQGNKRNNRMNEDKQKRIRQKREYKNKTYGYGGKKRGSKRNDKESFSADFLGKKKKGPVGGGRGAKGKKNRPGKARRQKKGKK